uniref:Uncharacterized protein n=1 Tax=Arundo donax TaxID=35708 RepID=A0A0A8ZGN0_ARUDO
MVAASSCAPPRSCRAARLP